MLDVKQVRQIFYGCGFQHAIKKEVRVKEPSEDTLNIVMKCIKIAGEANSLSIQKRAKLSAPTVTRCLNYLIETKEIEKCNPGDSVPFSKSLFRDTKIARLVY
tara:strand:+ start:8385 stop:8693 length:309 start_codon:yes stop_codon:yes gene_type:complete